MIPTKKQELARERNWNRALIIGNCGNLRHLCTQFGRGGIEQQLRNIETRLLLDNDERWQQRKEKV